ncbi:MAG: flagellar biosynthesis protein FlhF [Candidatus Margulisiibacteriota bacterium]|nr:MAG: flagellar biosynthesis protein FlhF [Candidatus Margulisbacteria bacterium GWD2_39_127]OGI05204.1 MAG: flagellar biosynthesis protein FlhF [Candidatus Margulisbacteria bacterium GWF2_38_17]OGI06253.1 MAG: flagellar biosynthesis protein FlhF [Candidatus Margulisbacteria bacterium GWE2_39_32]PZM78909.1 MAG: flagellar biosynthesis protein FlhF [Candidatus Margulisiibacteriota bacterium]HAR64507.1 flagellar biosynthesis protein FlhF [Candidatus Margulisiibacteriota bacterium]
MRIKKYKAKDMKEALVQVKQDFGPDAVILHSRNVFEGGMFGLFGREMVEVTAGGEINILEDLVAKKKEYFNIENNVPGASPRSHFKINVASNEAAKPVLVASDEKLEKLSKQISLVESQLGHLSQNLSVVINSIKSLNTKNYNRNLSGVFEYLIALGIKENIIAVIVKKLEEEMLGKDLRDKVKVEQFLRAELLSMIRTSGPIELPKQKQKIIAFIGSTGVGKTTTIAKLAANYTLMQKKKVALITIDTYRIAAIEQLKTYANIIGVPIDVVFTPEEFKQTLAAHKEEDLILIDTAGRSPKNTQQMKELKKFLDMGGPGIENILVISATSKDGDVEDTVSRFDIIKSENIVFTKLDETSTFGVIINVLYNSNKKLSYFTTGQNVPDDLEVAKDRDLLEKIMGQSVLEL